MCHATSFMRTRNLWCNRLGKVSNFTGSNALFSIPSANLRFLTFLALKFWFRASENVKWKSRNVVGFVSLTGWWAVTINESLPFGISLPLPAIIEIPLPALSSPVSRTPPAPCSPGLPPPCPPPLHLAQKKNLEQTRRKCDGTTRPWTPLPLEVFTGFVFVFCCSVQTAYISDDEMNLAAIKFWGRT